MSHSRKSMVCSSTGKNWLQIEHQFLCIISSRKQKKKAEVLMHQGTICMRHSTRVWTCLCSERGHQDHLSTSVGLTMRSKHLLHSFCQLWQEGQRRHAILVFVEKTTQRSQAHFWPTPAILHHHGQDRKHEKFTCMVGH